jgi:hypothetical protein
MELGRWRVEEDGGIDELSVFVGGIELEWLIKASKIT